MLFPAIVLLGLTAPVTPSQPIPLDGTVVGVDGHLIAGAEVVLADTVSALGIHPAVHCRVRSDTDRASAPEEPPLSRLAACERVVPAPCRTRYS